MSRHLSHAVTVIFSRRWLPAGLLAVALAHAPAAAEERAAGGNKLDVATYLEWETIANPQVSPDGKQVLYTRRWVDKLKDEWKSTLWLVDADGGHDRYLVDGGDAQWSPDGSRIAYLAKGEPGERQIFVRWMDGTNATTQITRVLETPREICWSPDGESIAFTMDVASEDQWKIDMPKPPEDAKWTKKPRLVETLHYRQDRRGFLFDGFTHLFVVSAGGGSPRQLTSGNWNVGSRTDGIVDDPGIGWTPDGRTIVFDGLKAEDADVRWRESHLYAIDVASKEIRQITNARGPWVRPAISPDGRRIAYVGFPWTQQTYKAEELWLIDMDGSDARRLAVDLDRDPEQVHWSQDGKGLYFTANNEGSRNVWYAPVGGGKARQVTKGEHILSLASVASNGLAAGIQSSANNPDDIVTYRLTNPGTINTITKVNDDVLEGRQLGAVEEIWYTSTGGARVQGWVVKPPQFDPARRYPMILQIHGGPHSMYGVGFNYSFQNLAANDYVVLYTNPRGSTGYGTAFGNAIDNAYPSVDYDDLMAGVDALVARGYIDSERLYVTGQSGGGVLSSWIIGHTNRFAAAAVRAPVIDWISFAGNTDIANWGYNRFHKPFWEDPAKWLQHSPLMYVQNVRTPVLLMTGELDLRTPMGQTEEYYGALKQLGVPVSMLRFNNEYHGTSSKPSNFMRTQLYLVSWFDRYPGASAVTRR